MSPLNSIIMFDQSIAIISFYWAFYIISLCLVHIDNSIFKNLITYLDDLINIQEGDQSLNINTNFQLIFLYKFLKTL